MFSIQRVNSDFSLYARKSASDICSSIPVKRFLLIVFTENGDTNSSSCFWSKCNSGNDTCWIIKAFVTCYIPSKCAETHALNLGWFYHWTYCFILYVWMSVRTYYCISCCWYNKLFPPAMTITISIWMFRYVQLLCPGGCCCAEKQLFVPDSQSSRSEQAQQHWHIFCESELCSNMRQ